jgi:TatD DNase family protein
MTILKNEEAFENGVLLHCFSGSVELAKEYIKLGAYISLAGPVTFKNSIKPKEVAKFVPLNRILIETDSPYLTPEPNRGKRNESSYVEYICNQIAILKEMSFDKVADATYENAKRFFKID